MRIPIVAALVVLTLGQAARAQHVVGKPAVVAAFDGSKLETPEGVAEDKRGNLYVSLNLTGEIRKIAPDGTQSTFAVMPLGAPPLSSCFNFVPIMGPPVIDDEDNVYIGVDSCDLASRGLWKIAPDGHKRLLGPVSGDALLNGLAIHGRSIYAADTALQLVWRFPMAGGAPEVFLDDPLLKKNADAPAIYPGPNGVEVFEDELYVSVSGGFRVVAIKLDDDDDCRREHRPPRIRVHATGTGCDDFAFDVHGNLYCGTDPFNTIVRIAPDGTQTTVLTSADGLDGPSATLFGRKGKDRFELYITNGSFPFFPNFARPSLLKVKMDVPGEPR